MDRLSPTLSSGVGSENCTLVPNERKKWAVRTMSSRAKCRLASYSRPSLVLLILGLLLCVLLVGVEGGRGAEFADYEKKCSSCRFFVNTFNEGLKKTVKSHFGGGNTAWEEGSLGKYATSETRLVEILEQACKKDLLPKSDLDKLAENNEHKCHAFLEENEEEVENWYFHKQRSDPDFHKYLCIDRVVVCCPKYTWGPDCTPCDGDPERPCFGNGNCDGSGTRGGSGKCICNKGYQGKLCRKCSTSHYVVSQNDTHVTCEGCHMACKGGCKAGGADTCSDCKTGWNMVEGKGCEDIDECIDESKCSTHENEKCVNTQGSFECVCETGYKREQKKCVLHPTVGKNETDSSAEGSGDDDDDDEEEDWPIKSDESESSTSSMDQSAPSTATVIDQSEQKEGKNTEL